MLQALACSWPLLWIHLHHELEQVEEDRVLLVEASLNKLLQRFHLQPRGVAGIPAFDRRPVNAHFIQLTESVLYLNGATVLKVNRPEVLAGALLSHPLRRGPALFLNHGEVLDLLTSLIKQLASVHFDENADHGPYIALLGPLATRQDDLRCAVLSSIDNTVVLLMIISGAAEVNDLDCVVQRTLPHALFFRLGGTLLSKRLAAHVWRLRIVMVMGRRGGKLMVNKLRRVTASSSVVNLLSHE